MKPVQYIADHLRRVLVNGASAPHTAEVEHFFKNVITSRGWYTNELRKLAKRFSRTIIDIEGIDYLFAVADNLFDGNVLEEKVLAVLVLEERIPDFKTKHFTALAGWIPRVSTWADGDALGSYLLGPMLVADPKRVSNVFRWAKSRNPWARRMAAVALIRGVREGLFAREMMQVSDLLMNDTEEIVQKGVGWLLREGNKFNREATLPYVRKMRNKMPRLVLRTACETVPKNIRTEMMTRDTSKALPRSKAKTA